ncbi:ATP-binding cassette sub-family G member 8 [Zea mays]|uniref:ATP-binding cassette sub-family G member 8 n=1 Tax=Zea mays TaxID=4577 RepID=UPI001652391B|nr:ATP-binding cassette sub-family G member 8-like [Zea mays]
MCADIIVGNELIRGISGGQKKRLTTGEMLVGPTKVLFMDEISMGLDSSTTFQIVKCIQQIVHLGEATVLASLLQPAPEVFGLFDDVMLLSEGQIVYQGPQEYVLEFFERCGFWCPQRKGVPDFLQEVTSKKDQEQYWIQNEKPYHYVSVPEFVAKFKKFHMGKSLKKQLSVPFHKRKIHKYALVFSEKSVSTLELLKSFLGRVLNKDIVLPTLFLERGVVVGVEAVDADDAVTALVVGCLYTMASVMLIFSAKAADIHQIIPLVKAAGPDKMSSNSEMVYGSEEDENDALAFLSAISEHDMELIETVMCHFREKFENLPEYCRCNLLFLSAHLLSTGYYKFPLQRYMALVDLQEGNERLFYKLFIDNIEEPLVRPAKSSYGGFIWLCRGKILEVLKTG